MLTHSKFQSYFVFVTLLLSCHFSYSQDEKTHLSDEVPLKTQGLEKAGNEVKPEQTKNDESAELPFRYLNQYFDYEIQFPQIILLNDRAYNIQDFKISKTGTKLKLTIEKSLGALFKTANLEFINESDKVLANLDVQLSDSKVEIESEQPSTVTSVCLVARSKYSMARLCKPVIPKTEKYETIEDSLKLVTADGVEIGDSGQVVLQDSNIRSNFFAEFKNGDKFYFETEKRKVYPSTINKKAGSLQINIRYVDLDDQTVAYDDVLVVSQRYFDIKLDPLISLRQDIVFSDEDLRNKAISRTLIDRLKLTIVAKNKFILVPMLSYQQYLGDNANLSFKLRTGMGFGISGQYIRNISPKWDWHVGANFMTTKIIFDDPNKVVSGRTQSIYEISGGGLYRLNSEFDFRGSLGVKNDLFAKSININQGLEVTAGLNKYFEGILAWKAFENQSIEVIVPVSLRFMLPGQVGNVDAKSGLGLGASIDGLYKTNWGRILGGLKYGSRVQNYDDFNFKEDYYYMNGGIIYLF